MYIYSSNTTEYTGEVLDRGDRYEIHFPRFGKLNKEYTNGLAWVLDEDTVFFFERPYRDTVKKILKKLLSEDSIVQHGNDIIINGVKVGPTFMTGYIHDIDGPPHEMNGGIIYCLRWRNIEELNEIFAGNSNHEERLNNPFKQKFSSLDQFLTCTKEEFEEMLEKVQ